MDVLLICTKWQFAGAEAIFSNSFPKFFLCRENQGREAAIGDNTAILLSRQVCSFSELGEANCLSSCMVMDKK